MTKKIIKTKDIVFLKTLDATDEEHGLDQCGHMKKMVGKFHEVIGVSVSSRQLSLYSNSASRNFSFHHDDVLTKEELQEIEKKIEKKTEWSNNKFSFDENDLVI